MHSVLSLCMSAGTVRVACEFAAGGSAGVQRAVAAVTEELAAGVCVDKAVVAQQNNLCKIRSTRQTGGLMTGYKPLIIASTSRRWLSLFSSHIVLITFAAPVRGVLTTSYH